MAGRKTNTPNVNEQEIDKSELTIGAGTNTGAIVITSPKGPVNRPVLVTSDQDFIEQFGEPVISGTSLVYGYGAYASLAFLQESSSLYVIRAATATEDYFAKTGIGTNALGYSVANIGASAGPVADQIDSIYAIDNAPMSGAQMIIGAVSPGDWGNDIAVTIETLTSASDWFYSYDDLPVGYATSAIPTSAMTIANSVFKINVYKKETTETWESFTQTSNSTSALSLYPQETFYGTLRSQLDGNNDQLFIKDVVNGKSSLIYVDVNDNATTITQSTNPNQFLSTGDYFGVKNASLIRLSGGNQVAKSGIGTYYSVWDYFKNKDEYDISIVLVPDYSMNVKQLVCQNVVGYRKDCYMVTQSGTVTDTTVQQIWTAEQGGYTDPSYVFAYAGWDKVYDKYNSKYVYLPKSIQAGAVIAKTDATIGQSPAGMTRGILPIVGVNKVWSEPEIGQLYDRNINTSRYFRGIGHVLWGQKTCQRKASALDRINVRMLLVYIRKSMARSLMSYVLDVNNTAKTRLRIWSNLDSFLAPIKSQEGLYAYTVQCDEENNTQQVIDANELDVNVFVQPTKTIEYISLKTIVTRTGVTTTEV